MKRKIISLILVLYMVIVMLPIASMADSSQRFLFCTDASTGETMVYSINEGLLTVSGSVSAASPAYVAVYDNKGKQLSVKIITSPEKVDVSGGDTAKLIWLNAGKYTVKTECVKMPVKGANFTIPHIMIRGLIGDDRTKHQITYSVEDEDNKAVLDDKVTLVENGEEWGTLDFAKDTANAESKLAIFVGIRAWLPVMWTFADTDFDEKYDVIERKVYCFDKVSDITDDNILLENFGMIDRKDTDGKEYAWSSEFSYINKGDWVIYYSDGAVSKGAASAVVTYLAMAAGPKFDDSGLYGDTYHASFQKMDFANLTIEKISDYDFVFDGTTYRPWSANGSYYKDLVSGTTVNAEIGESYDLWYTDDFGGIIASANYQDSTGGRYFVVTGVDDKPPYDEYGDFTIHVIDNRGNYNDFVVKGSKQNRLNEYFVGDGLTRTKQVALTYANLSESIETACTKSKSKYVLCEYKTNSEGLITTLKVYGNTYEVLNTDGEHKTYYNSRTRVLNKKYQLDEDAVIFAINADTEEVHVFIGEFPLVNNSKSVEFVGYILNEGMKALITVIHQGSFSSWQGTQTTVLNDRIGYLRSIDRCSDHYEYTIAYGDNAAALFKSREGDIDTIVADDDIFTTDDWSTQMGRKAGMILFDVTANGTIKNMRIIRTSDMTTTSRGARSEYLAAYIVEKIDYRRNSITLRPISNAYVNASGMPKNGTDLWSAWETAGIFAEYDADASEVFYLTANTSVIIINPSTTNQAGVKIGNISDLQKSSLDKNGYIKSGMVVTLAYDGENSEIVSIFANKEIVQ